LFASTRRKETQTETSAGLVIAGHLCRSSSSGHE
jgi:hypothetical protein